MKNTNILYFEGAGCNYNPNEKSDIGNYRIRTAFINNEGKLIYLELGGHEFSDKKKGIHWKTHIDHAFYITNDNDDNCNNNRINYNWQYIRDNVTYTKKNIVKYINKLCNTNFDTMEVLDFMEDYRVHGDNYKYNLMDNHIVNRKRTEARKKAYKEVDMDYRKKLNEKYSKISLLKMDDESITIRCYASSQSMLKAGLTEQDREKTIIINY
ncbi:hypothetical protein CF086_17075 [Clostridium botulinum]|uniref:hypothetical protein n=1 Tax=Clostridium botulinum TaxID=1491 RepID=UPI0007743774|nr:hypothetical protein [Clostridium botulinum]MBN3352009.1 hypothetical protein [Clostridium botulinum]